MKKSSSMIILPLIIVSLFTILGYIDQQINSNQFNLNVFHSERFQGGKLISQINSMINEQKYTGNGPNKFDLHLYNGMYFEGWYYKQVDKGNKNSFAVVPGVYITDRDDGVNLKEKIDHTKKFKEKWGDDKLFQVSHAFIFIIVDGLPAQYYAFDIQEFQELQSVDDKIFSVRIGENYFDSNGFSLDIKSQNFGDATYEFQAKFKFEKQDFWQKSLLKPSVMGFFQYLPFLECYHGVVSMSHNIVQGQVKYYDTKTQQKYEQNYENGIGYIEKDYGQRFPQKWVWIETNHLSQNMQKIENGQFFFSIARVPFLDFGSMYGFLGTLKFGDEFYFFSTHQLDYVENFEFESSKNGGENGKNSENDTVNIVIKNYITRKKIEIQAIRGQFGVLYAPTRDGMKKFVKESLEGKVKVKLSEFSWFDSEYEKTLFEAEGENCGLEIEGWN